jgi:hypothetical protein
MVVVGGAVVARGTVVETGATVEVSGAFAGYDVAVRKPTM